MQDTSRTQTVVNLAEGDHIPWGWVALIVVGLEIALIVSAFAWVAIYSYLISPGHDLPYYEKHAEFASPIVSVVVGIPYFFFASRWVGRKAGMRAVATCLWVWFIIFSIDVLLILVGGPNAYIVSIAAISHATKVLAAYFGGRAALRDVLRSPRTRGR